MLGMLFIGYALLPGEDFLLEEPVEVDLLVGLLAANLSAS